VIDLIIEGLPPSAVGGLFRIIHSAFYTRLAQADEDKYKN
jgi:hypothetical protein